MKQGKSSTRCGNGVAVRTVAERLVLLDQGFHNNRLENQLVAPERRAEIKDMVRAGKSTDEICAKIVAHYASRASLIK